ncbi:MAG: hypothetical protein A2345_08500 [Sulfurimonas sp. RIFOXYB12_FULL_35_9]|nr:MAG: hypothetical protein A2345_08500 [Sulfurimonas sp. RIFOXYB12_FULL_35_9]
MLLKEKSPALELYRKKLATSAISQKFRACEILAEFGRGGFAKQKIFMCENMIVSLALITI